MGLRQACRWPRRDEGENELVQPGFVLPPAWDENLLSLRERVVSALCCVLMERSGVFLVFPTVQAHCRSPTGRSSTGSNAPRPYKWLGHRMQRATMGVIYTSGEIAIAMQPTTSTAVKVFYSTVATAQLAVHTETESIGFVGNLIRQQHSRCRILTQNMQLSTNEGAFARRVSGITCTAA